MLILDTGHTKRYPCFFLFHRERIISSLVSKKSEETVGIDDSGASYESTGFRMVWAGLGPPYHQKQFFYILQN